MTERLPPYLFRELEPGDSPAMAKIIRTTLAEFGADRPGTVFEDPSTDQLFDLFQKEKAHYFVLETDGIIRGGAGIYPSPGLPDDTVELVKMYLTPEGRGRGFGAILIQKCVEKASEFGFKRIYLETMPELKKAIQLYEQFGFHYLDEPMGNTGHFGCGIWMIRELRPMADHSRIRQG